MNDYIKTMQSLTTMRRVILSCLGFLTLYWLLNFTTLPFSILTFKTESTGHTILNVLPYYSSSMAYEYISSYSPRAVEIYYLILVFDVVLLIPTYIVFLTFGTLNAGRFLFPGNLPKGVRFFSWFPLSAAILNIVEDATIVFLLYSFPAKHMGLASFCGLMTSTKSFCLVTSLFVTVLLYLGSIIKLLLEKLKVGL